MQNIPKISIICAIAEDGAIGKNNQLLWDIPEDMKFFRETTKGHPVIMGRKTYESIGRPLPRRTNIIVTRNTEYTQEGCEVVQSLENAIELAKSKNEGEIFIIGGGEIYKQGMKLVDTLYLTVVKGKFEADTYFPDYSDFDKVVSRKDCDNGEYEFSFLELERSND